jgi:hypothetical protein
LIVIINSIFEKNVIHILCLTIDNLLFLFSGNNVKLLYEYYWSNLSFRNCT